MKKLITILSLVALICLHISCKKDGDDTTTIISTPGVEFLQNGNLDNTPFNWYIGTEPANGTNPNNYAMGLTEEFAASPKKSFKISCEKVNNESAFAIMAQSFSTANLKKGAKLTLRTKIKAVNLVGQGLSIAIRGDKASQSGVFFRTTQGTVLINGTFDFKEFSVTLDSYAGDVETIIVYMVFLPNTTGTAYFDDISLKAE